MVKRVCNSGATETLTVPMYTHTVSTEELDMIMNCTQNNLWIRKQLNLSRQRECVIRTATHTEIVLPLALDSEQASTAAPPDDERDLFGREEALRMDEEI